MSAKVEIYTKDYCPYCTKAKLLLDQLGAAYVEYNIQHDADKMAELQERRPGSRTVPQIFIAGAPIGGCDDMYALQAEGKLKPLLGL